MDEPVETDLANPGRRRVLAGMLTAYTASLIPWAVAAPIANQSEGVFLAVSAILVGQTALDAALGNRLHAALATASPHFDADAQALLTLIDNQHIDPAKLQATLDAAGSPLAALPRTVMRAWCLGLVGEGEATRCIAYEEALDAVMVADVLKPPTYAYGPYGSWSKPPIAKGNDDHDHANVG